jgi:hypothetical protein
MQSDRRAQTPCNLLGFARDAILPARRKVDEAEFGGAADGLGDLLGVIDCVAGLLQ